MILTPPMVMVDKQVVEAVNPSQKKNAMIFNALFQLHTAVTNLLPAIPPLAIEYIDDALKQLARFVKPPSPPVNSTRKAKSD
jgi:hypothetical protein